jgi:tripartite ATP-independent transporter DctM subunit
VVIPPSALAVLLGSLAEINVGALLIAGVIPGLILMCLFIGLIFVQTAIDPEAAPQYPVPQVSGWTKIRAIALNILPMSFLVFCVVGTIIMGIATPTESAALGCMGVLVLLVVYRKFSWSVIWKSLDDAMKVTAMTFLIITASTTFSQIFAFSGASNGFITTITGFEMGPYGVLLMMILVILVLGAFMDQVSMMLITIPLFMPIAQVYGFDPVWFGLMLLLAYEVGFVTPPFGLLLYIVLGVAPSGTSLRDIAMSAAPYVGLTLLLIFLIAMVPQLALFLPSLMGN